MNVAGALMLADSAAQVPALKAQILANDAADPQGTLIAEVATAYDLLPGTPAEQKQKLEVLDRIRGRVTPSRGSSGARSACATSSGTTSPCSCDGASRRRTPASGRCST